MIDLQETTELIVVHQLHSLVGRGGPSIVCHIPRQTLLASEMLFSAFWLPDVLHLGF